MVVVSIGQSDVVKLHMHARLLVMVASYSSAVRMRDAVTRRLDAESHANWHV